MADLPPPVKVSPTIKLFRYTFLIAGFFYGVSKHNFLAKREVGIKEQERIRKIARDAKIAEERKIASEKDIAMIIALAETPPKKPDDDDDE